MGRVGKNERLGAARARGRGVAVVAGRKADERLFDRVTWSRDIMPCGGIRSKRSISTMRQVYAAPGDRHAPELDYDRRRRSSVGGTRHSRLDVVLRYYIR